MLFVTFGLCENRLKKLINKGPIKKDYQSVFSARLQQVDF